MCILILCVCMMATMHSFVFGHTVHRDDEKFQKLILVENTEGKSMYLRPRVTSCKFKTKCNPQNKP